MKKADLSILGKEETISLIKDEWMLITAGTSDKYNTMTANWGGIGYLWCKPVAFIFVRPERYTHDFIEETDRVTLSFYSEEYRKALQFCGSKSGRDYDKAKETGLTPIQLESGTMTFGEARITLDCRILYKQDLTSDSFIDTELRDRWYNEKQGGYHTVYIVEIETVYEG